MNFKPAKMSIADKDHVQRALTGIDKKINSVKTILEAQKKPLKTVTG
ncbi:hypothetical protein NU08_4091 [Flavobacterium anhuiense]|uniref:Uncharacterized protein n=1 Tax=Flavobacterium anhuiense TaxID=459526 RepID=A0A444VTM9_9FLAO|nr:hypothetical protein NU08_4091 [Flavobacterium anhuiense]